MSITDATARAALKSGTAKLADGHSLFLVVRRGRGFWVWQYRNGRTFNSMGLGPYPRVTVAAARKEREARAVARRSAPSAADSVTKALPARPVTKTTEKGKDESFADALLGYITEKSIDWRGGAHGRMASEYVALGTGSLGPLTAEQITDETIAAYVEGVRRPAVAKNRIEAVRAYMLTGKARMKAAPVEHHAAIAWADIPDFYRRLARVESPQARALAFTLLTVARVGDLVGTADKDGATWAEIDGGLWTIPASRTKNGLPHIVPLSDAAVSLLGSRGADEARLINISYGPVYDLLKELAPEATIHGLRSSFKDWCMESEKWSVDDTISEIALAHKVGSKVRQAYARSSLIEKRRALMEDWADFATEN